MQRAANRSGYCQQFCILSCGDAGCQTRSDYKRMVKWSSGMVADLHRQIERWTVIAASAMDIRFSLTGHLQFSFIRLRTFKWVIAGDICSLSHA